MMDRTLFTAKQWESAKPPSVVYDHIFYSKEHPGKVVYVHGFIKLRRRVLMNDGHSQRKPCVLKAVWNAGGLCFMGCFRTRVGKYDIPLKG